MNVTAWLVDTINVAAVTGAVDSYGKPTYAAPTAVKARVETVRRLARNPRGQDAIATHVIYTTTAIALSSRVWLPGAATTDANAKTPISVTANHDKKGAVTLYEVALG